MIAERFEELPQLVRPASLMAPALFAGEPQLIRKPSGSQLKIQIQLPKLSQSIPAAEQTVMIETGAEANEETYVCGKTIAKCGHKCYGVKEEKRCTLPCLEEECAKEQGLLTHKDETCMICHTYELGEDACAKLACGHVFHVNCIVGLLKAGCATLRLNFDFLKCPLCRDCQIDLFTIEEIAAELRPLVSLKAKVEKMAISNCEAQGVFSDRKADLEVGGAYHGRRLDLAMKSCTFYKCHDCQKPYFGGLIDCAQQMDLESRQKAEDLKCQECLAKELGAGSTECAKHGKIQIDWKCMYCCSVALFCCFGTHYMCDPCHSRYNWGIMPLKDCHGVDCPLGIAHPRPHNDPRKGGVFPLGCGICRSEKLEVIQRYKASQELNAGVAPAAEPKAWIYDKNAVQIDRPLVEVDVPEFIWRAEEIQQEADEAEAERLRKMPIYYLPPSKLLKKQRAQRRKAERSIVPEWMIEEPAEEPAEEVKEAPLHVEEDELPKAAASEALAQADAASKHRQQIAKKICAVISKKARPSRRRK